MRWSVKPQTQEIDWENTRWAPHTRGWDGEFVLSLDGWVLLLKPFKVGMGLPLGLLFYMDFKYENK